MSQFGISQSDLTPSPIPSVDYATLTADVTSIADVITKCEATVISWCGGMFTEAANIALAKPQVVYVVVWYLHFQLSQQGEYEIPKAIQTMLESARAWAAKTGQALLAAEGSVQLPGAATVQHGTTPPRHTRAQMDLL